VKITISSIFFGLLLINSNAISSSLTEGNIPVTEKSEQQRLADFDQWIDRLDAKKEISGTFLYARNGKVLYSKAVGKVHPHKNTPITIDSSFNLASVSKQFTAFGIMLLKYQGKLKYDDHVQNILKEFPYPNITVRQLLNHTSGITDYEALSDAYWDKQAFTNQDMLNLFSIHKPKLDFAPNTHFEYSNTGYVVLAAIIERLSKQSMEDFSYQNIFKPLNMSNSRVFTILSKQIDFPSRVFGQYNDELLDLYKIEGVTGDGAVYSTVGDLLKWHKALLNNTLLPESEKREAFKHTPLVDGSSYDYNFGWFVDSKSPHKMAHSGSWVGFITFLTRNEKDDALLIFLTNNLYGVKYRELHQRFYSSVDADIIYATDDFTVCEKNSTSAKCN
jgi:CubicO group peptidase (beta-lactamase class C family)